MELWFILATIRGRDNTKAVATRFPPRCSATEGDAKDGDDSDHGESVAAKPYRDQRNELGAGADVIRDHHL